jgi:hypothetical protein
MSTTTLPFRTWWMTTSGLTCGLCVDDLKTFQPR